MEDKKPLTHQPFGQLLPAAFVPPTPRQNNERSGDKKRDGRHRPRNHGLKEAKTTMEQTHAQQIGKATDAENGETVSEQRRQAREATRSPMTGNVDPTIGRLLDAMGQIVQQNSHTLSAITSMYQATLEKQTVLLQGLANALEQQAQNATQESEAVAFFANEARRAKKGKKSLFGKSRMEKAEDAAWGAGKIALGGAVGYGAVKLATIGAKALFGV